jgi:hypothetical protein
MNAIRLEGASYPIDGKSYLQEEKKKIIIQTIKYVALSILLTLGSTLLLCYMGCFYFTGTLLTFNAKPLLIHNFLNTCFSITAGLQTFPFLQILSNIYDLIPIFRALSKLQPKKENALIITSPAIPLHLKNVIKLTEKYNLKIFTTSSRYGLKSILNSFPKNSIKMLILQG